MLHHHAVAVNFQPREYIGDVFVHESSAILQWQHFTAVVGATYIICIVHTGIFSGISGGKKYRCLSDRYRLCNLTDKSQESKHELVLM